MKIAITAPSCPLHQEDISRLQALAQTHGHSLSFHPQCFLEHGHFAGDDATRLKAFTDMANDPTYDALWCARGGYGACRIAEQALPLLNTHAAKKIYLGYSDAGFLLAGLYRHKIGTQAHAPMPNDIKRQGGEGALVRVFQYLNAPEVQTHEVPHIALNLSICANLLGTALEPDLAGHILMLEEVAEYHYAIDRLFFRVTSSANVRRVAGIKLGRCSDIPMNDRAFGMAAEEICQFWCERAGIAYLGSANIGHDCENAIIRFGL
jgi:muramoyltetrapeptide carboxypeptidase